MAKKKKDVDLSTLTKEELIKKIENQRGANGDLSKKVKELSRENDFLREMYSSTTVSKRVQIAMEETMSLMEDVERMKKLLAKYNIKDE